jgi:hypothetical protein
MGSITECYDSAIIYISEIDDDEKFNPLDNTNSGTFDKFIGAYVGCIIGNAINKVINKPIDDIQLQTIDDIQLQTIDDKNININEHIDNIVANINDGDYIAYNEIYIDGEIVELSQNTIDIINNKIQERTIQNIKLFNKENKEIIKHTEKHLDLSQNIKNKIDTQIIEYNNFTTNNIIKIEESFKTFSDVMDEKNTQYFLKNGYHTYHNVLPKPKMQTIKCHGEGKLGNFILMIPIITIPFGGGGGIGGGGGCCIL